MCNTCGTNLGHMISRSEEIWWDVDIEIFTVSRLEKNACILICEPLGQPVDGVVVEDDGVAVRREGDVELDAPRAVPGAQPHRLEAVLGRVEPGGAVGDPAHVVPRAGRGAGGGLLVDGGPVEVAGVAAEDGQGGYRVGRRQPGMVSEVVHYCALLTVANCALRG